MNCSAVVTVEGDSDKISKLFETEKDDFKHNRSEYSIKKEGKKTVFEVSAKDATALRSTLDSISKALKIYEDMKEIK